MKNSKEKIRIFYLQSKLFLHEKYDEILTYPVIKYILSVSNNIISFTKDFFSFYLKNYNIRKLLEMTLSRMNIYISTALKLIDFWFNSGQLLTYSFEYDSQTHLKYTQILPIYWKNLAEFPTLLSTGYTQEETSFDITLFYMQAHNFVREFLTAVSTRTLLPPFSSTAMIIGDNQIRTFDGKFYSFAANCSYLLTRDFNHNRFSVAAHYENSLRKSISIDFDEDIFYINRDGKVLWNNRLLELPLLHKEIYVSREGNKIVLLNKKGLKVIFNIISQVCIFKISGWYYGKVGGLLGVYDNEPSNDMMTSQRVIEKNVAAFLRSWHISEHCTEELVSPPSNPSVEWDRRKCEEMFGSDISPLVPCFGTVDPTPFKYMCIEQMSFMKQNPMFTRGFCQIAGAYIEYCKENSVEMWLPGECFMCDVPNSNPIRGGDITNFLRNSAPRSADIIIVLQHGECLENFDFKTILHLVETSMLDLNIRNNQYSVVAYGGPDELHEPHSFTSLGRIFNTVESASDTIKR